MAITNASTNATLAVDTGDVPISGFIQYIELRNLTPGKTCDVQVVTVTNDVGDIETSLLKVLAFTDSVKYNTRFPVHDSAGTEILDGTTTNRFDNLLLLSKYLQLQCTNASATGMSIVVNVATSGF